jgi:hypothetical protein
VLQGPVQSSKGDKEMKEKDRKPYEKPAVVFERELEAVAAYCGEGLNNHFLGADNCKATGQCATPNS